MSEDRVPDTAESRPADPRREIFSIVRAIAFIGFLAFLLWLAGDVLLLLFAGVLVAIFIDGIAGWIRAHTRVGHGVSIAIALLGVLTVFGVVVIYSAPEVAEQVNQLGAELPRSVENLHRQLDQHRWVKVLLDQIPTASELRSPGIGLVRKATGALSSTVVVLARVILIAAIGIFLAIQPNLYRNGVIRLVPIRKRVRAAEILDAVTSNLRGWLVGKVLSAIAIGVATWTGLQLLGIPLALILSVLAALLSFIPNFGPVVAVIPAMLLGLMQSSSLALYVGLLYLGIQVVETYLLTPWLAHRTANLPPALTLVTQILLGVLFGGMGVIMAAPVTAVGMVLVRMIYVEDVLGDRGGAPLPEPDRGG
jgi:predicted PurR-regulated permease PerM